MAGYARGRFAIEYTATVGSDINASVDARIACDLQDESPLVLVVVDAGPGAGFVDRAEDPGLAADGSGDVEGGVGTTRSGFAEAEGVDFCDARKAREEDGACGVTEGEGWGVIKAIEGGEPKIAGATRRRVEAILTATRIAERSRGSGRRVLQCKVLGDEGRSCIVTAIEGSIRQRD